MTDKPKVTQAAAVQWPQSRRKPVSYVSAYLADEADEQSQDDGSEMMTDKPKVTQADERREPIRLYLGPFMRDQHTPLDEEGLRWLADQLCSEERVDPDRTMATGYIPYQAAYEFPHLLDCLIAAEQSQDDTELLREINSRLDQAYGDSPGYFRAHINSLRSFVSARLEKG